jgi:hypothetical protein
MIRQELIIITIEKKDSFPKDVDYEKYMYLNNDVIIDYEKILHNKFLLNISKNKAYQLHQLEPNLLENLEHINIYALSEPTLSTTR